MENIENGGGFEEVKPRKNVLRSIKAIKTAIQYLYEVGLLEPGDKSYVGEVIEKVTIKYAKEV